MREDLERRAGLVALDAAHRRLDGQVPVGLALLRSLPITGRLCAMATISPVPGWIMFMVEMSGSLGPTTAADLLLRHVLGLGVDRGLDGQPTALDQVLALLGRLAEAGRVSQGSPHIVTEERVPSADAAIAGSLDFLLVETNLLGLLSPGRARST